MTTKPTRSSCLTMLRTYMTDINEVQDLLQPIAKKWKSLGSAMGLGTKVLLSIEDEASSEESRMILMVTKHRARFQEQSSLRNGLEKIGEEKVAALVPELQRMDTLPLSSPIWYRPQPQLPPQLQLEHIKPKFSELLSATTNTVKHKPPRELINMLSCFDGRFSALTKDCKDTDDVIAVLIDSVTFFDYDLLQYIAIETKDETLEAKVQEYVIKLKNHLECKIHKSSISTYFTVKKELCILPEDTRTVSKLRKALKSIHSEKVNIYFSNDLIKPKELKGVEVLEEVQVEVKRSIPKLFHWKGYGLKIKVPPNHLSYNIDSLTITIRVSLSGQYQFPDGTELVSPVFWLSCEPTYPYSTFSPPLSLEIQHCALPEKSHRLFMAKALCTQDELPYSFKVQHKGTFNKHSSYGIIEMSSFSGVGVVQERSEERRYWSSVFYMGPPNSRDIHFAVTWHSDAHITNLEKSYQERKAVPGPKQPLLFRDDKVALDIPKEGINTKDGWTLYPATPPTITKKEIDDHHPESRTVPHCELLACWEKDDKQMKSLHHTINILGTTQESYFLININPSQRVDTATTTEDATPSTTKTKLEIRHLHNICECLKDLPSKDITRVGLALGLHYPNLMKMEMFPQDMVHAWLQQKDSVSQQPTTEALIQALQNSNLQGTADIVKTKFIHSLE